MSSERPRSAGLTLRLVMIGFGLVTLAAACTMDFDEFVHTVGGTCTPNAAQPCVGPGSCDGTQVCRADGKSFGPCNCGTGGTGTGGTGTGGQGGGGGQGGTGTGGTGGSGGPCGNGALDSGEGCDDGNTAASDGCDSLCAIEGQADQCPTGALFDLTSAGLWITDTTVGKATGNNTSCGGNSAGDVAYQITPAQDGTVTITLEGSYDKVLAVRTGCTPGSDAVCETGTNPLTGTRQVQTGTAFHVIVTGLGGAEGQFVLHLSYD